MSDIRAALERLVEEADFYSELFSLETIATARAALAAEPVGVGPSLTEQPLTIQKLLAFVEDLEGALLSAADSLEEWGGYVEPHFKAKHAFDADVANARSHAQRARNVINGKDIIGEIND